MLHLRLETALQKSAQPPTPHKPGSLNGLCSMSITTTNLKSVFFILLFLGGCTPSIMRPTPDQYSLQIIDNPAEYRFDITLQSNDSKPLCVSIENWPSREGQLHMGSSLATLLTDAGAFTARDENFGYCPGGCGQHRIGPSGELRGHISYKAFGDPVRLAADKNKRLQFSVAPSYCRGK